ncbi:MAG: ERCC4 domain-containing protein [Clostridia bacterium]|nr:ERCC4 domain-containing protein [Clostridia bacterium]
MENILQTMFLLVDTREQPTEQYYKRLDSVGIPYRRQKLDFGDYSCGYLASDGFEVLLDKEIVIERKMSLDEICANFTKGRDRFAREFERAANSSAKVHLIVENGNYEKILKGTYRSKLNSNSLLASFMAFADRYNISVHFCKPDTTPTLINKIFYHHIRNKLMKDLEFEV